VKRGAAALAGPAALAGAAALAAALLASALFPARGSAATAGAPVSALDLIELQISYTTLLARYYRPLAPRTLVDGARTGIAAELAARGVRDARLPFTPAHVDFSQGSDAIDDMVLRSLAHYGSRLNAHALVVAAVAGELASVRDPYTLIFKPPQFKKFNAYLGNERFGGVGLVLDFDPSAGTAIVERVLPGGPAATAGLLAGDGIVAVDGRPVAELHGAGVRDALRGKIGTTVRVAVRRGGADITYALVRAEVSDPQVHTALFGTTGYLALSRFGSGAGAELKAALGDLSAKGARAFVLDLRGNGGGYGDQATEVASDFIASGPIFTVRERGGTSSVSRATGGATFHGPLAVLVDGDTASAAEIVAGAIQDDAVGTLVGTRTFGKGLVQSVFPLPDGSAIKMTTARYTTPKGRDIDRVGIEPDVLVPEPPGSRPGDPATDPQLARALAAVAASRACGILDDRGSPRAAAPHRSA
jgi:carboxyl-terminal processing protease